MTMDTEKLLEEVKNHLATFPERRKDNLEMQEEWKKFKEKAVIILIGFVGSVLAIGVWVGTMQTSLEASIKDHDKISDTGEILERRINALEVNNGEIRARLTSIDLSLIEIKQSLK